MLQGECEKNPSYMLGTLDDEEESFKAGHCRFSCGICLAPILSGEQPWLKVHSLQATFQEPCLTATAFKAALNLALLMSCITRLL